MKKEYELRERKAGKFKLKMTFAIIVLAALSIVELYLMMNYQTEYLYLGIVGLGILCFVYWVVDISFKMQQENDSIGEWEYENLYKAEKVSYISMKQNFSDIEKMLQGMTDLPIDDVIQSQKAVGKVMVQRNKENTQTIMDSHKELAERIDAVETKINELKEMLDAVSTQTGGEAQNHQQEILNILQRLEASAAQGIQISQGTVMQDELNLEEPVDDSSAMEEPIAEESAVENSVVEEPTAAEESPATAEAEVSEIEEPTAAEEPAAEPPEIEEPTATEEPAAEPPVIEETTIEESAAESPVVEEATAAEESPAEAPIIEELATEEEPLVQEEAAEAPITPEEKPDMSNLTDPNHVMTPEEIAALLANM